MILVSPEAAGIIHHQRPISSCHVCSVFIIIIVVAIIIVIIIVVAIILLTR